MCVIRRVSEAVVERIARRNGKVLGRIVPNNRV